MRAAQLVEYRKPLEVTHIPEPNCGPTDVIIEVTACGICRTDWHLWNGDWAWIGFRAELPHVPGHEIAGVVTEVGSQVRRLHVGDTVAVPWHLACGSCPSCRGAHTNTCENVGMTGFGGYDGAYAEYVAVPNADLNVIAIPASIDRLDAFGLGCRYMSAFGAVVHQGAVQAGEWVAVIGAGGLGLSAVQIATAAGANVVAVDINDEKLNNARAQGAIATVNASSAHAAATAVQDYTGGGAHLSLDTVCREETITTACLGTRRQGRVVQAGYTTQPACGVIGIPMDALSLRELRLVGSGAGMRHSQFSQLLSLVERGVLKPSTIVTERIGLDAVTAVYEAMDNFSNIGFSVITSF
jgi:D-arabinose 1-dehydrogenase-like Zn-dependent alcohol dehydrogenase